MTAIVVTFPTSPSGAELAAPIETVHAARSRPGESLDANWALVFEGVGLVTIPLLNDKGEA